MQIIINIYIIYYEYTVIKKTYKVMIIYIINNNEISKIL
jgi:hypothetical protein